MLEKDHFSDRMGGSSSKNTSTTLNQIVNSAITNSIQNCASGVSQNQVLSVIGNNNQNVNLGDLDWTQAATIDAQCLQSSSVQNTLSTNLQNQLQQFSTSQSTIAALSQTQSANVNNLTNQLANEVVNQFNKNCSNPASLTQLFQIEYNNGGSVNTGTLNWNQTTQNIVNCVQNDQVYTNLSNQIANAVGQSSSAKTQSLLGSIFGSIGNIIIILVVIVVIIIIIIVVVVIIRKSKQQQSGGGSAASNPAVRTAALATPYGRMASVAGVI